jgi:phospholipid transport system substrate-binding protein
VGRQWDDLPEADQQAWRQKFSELTISNYAGRFVGYTGEAFSTVGQEPAARDTVMVLTRLDVPGDQPVDMNYRLRETRGGWRIIDIYLKGTVSELALRRSEYSSTLTRDGFEKLAAAIDKKIAELREDSDS